MGIEGLNPLPLRNAAAEQTPSKEADQAKLKTACQDFEQLFLTQMLQQMRSSIPKDGMLGGGQQEEMFNGMLDQERAKAWSQDGGIGLANLLFQQMKDQS